jgi:O-antigen/teichoic acid export membrane protein
VAAALLVAGIATYAFFIVGEWAVGSKEGFQPISTLWFATFALAPGFFLPLEQELGRALSHRRALGQGGRPVVLRIVTLGIGLVTIVVVGMLLLSPLLVDSLFDGDWWMMAALICAFAAYAPAHLARGVCSGSGRFHSYATILGGDGVVRIVVCVVMAAIGITAAGAYGFLVALAPLVGLSIVSLRGQLGTDDGPPSTWAEVTPNLGWLLLGSVSAAALLNAGPLATELLADETDTVLVADFSKGVLLARIPLFMFQAVQAALLPRLSRLAAQGQLDEFRRGLRQLATVVVAVGVIGTTGAFVLGPFVLEVVFDADLSGRTLAMLALGSACYMMALAMAQAVIALKGHAFVSVGWLAGVVAFVLATWLSSDDLFRRVEIGLLVSSIVAMIAFALALRQRLASGVVPDEGSIIEAMTDQPLET